MAAELTVRPDFPGNPSVPRGHGWPIGSQLRRPLCHASCRFVLSWRVAACELISAYNCVPLLCRTGFWIPIGRLHVGTTAIVAAGTIVLLALAASPAEAQTTYATLTGTVTDSSGGVIRRGRRRHERRDVGGHEDDHQWRRRVHRAQLREGPYTLSITAPGLREFIAVDIVLVTRDPPHRRGAPGGGLRGGRAGDPRQRADRARDAAHQRRAHGGAAPDAAAQRSRRLVDSGDHAVAVVARRHLLVRRQQAATSPSSRSTARR